MYASYLKIKLGQNQHFISLQILPDLVTKIPKSLQILPDLGTKIFKPERHFLVRRSGYATGPPPVSPALGPSNGS